MSPDKREAKSEDLRRVRLAASLRENLKRRKAQSRARQAEVQPADSPAGPASGEPERLTAGPLGGAPRNRVGLRQRDRGWIGYKFAAGPP